MRSQTKKLSFKFEYDDKDYETDVTIYFTVDTEYGSDADGNRGIYKKFIDEMVIERLIDSGGNNIIDIQEDLYDYISEESNAKFFEGSESTSTI